MRRFKALKSRRLVAPKQTEAQIEGQVVRLFTLAGCVVYRVSGAFGNQRGGTRLTPGLADLTVFFPLHAQGISPMGRIIFCVGYFETKTPAGLAEHHRLAPLNAPPTPSQMKAWRKVRAQAAFAALCRARGIPYGIGGMDAAWAFLGSVGLAGQVNGAWLLTREGK